MENSDSQGRGGRKFSVSLPTDHPLGVFYFLFTETEHLIQAT